MSLAALARRWFAPDPRSDAEIEDEIERELEFHLAEASDELVRQGLSLDAARARARERFGDVTRVRDACRRAQMGDRIVVVRIQWVVIVVLVLVAGLFAMRLRAEQALAAQQQALAQEALAQALAAQAEAATAQRARAVNEALAGASRELARSTTTERVEPAALDLALQPRQLLARFRERPDDWRHGLALAEALAADGELALSVLREIYSEIPLAHREQLFKPFVFGSGSEIAVSLLDLGAHDTEGSVRARAFGYLLEYAFRDLSSSTVDCDAWFARFGALPIADVLRENGRELVRRLGVMDRDALLREVPRLSSLRLEAARRFVPDFGSELERAGLLARTRQWFGEQDPRLVAFAVRTLDWMRLDEMRVRGELQALEGSPFAAHEDVARAYFELVGKPGFSWAIEPLIGQLRRSANGESGLALGAASALAKIRDVRAVPQALAVLVDEANPQLDYAVGYYTLEPLTGVVYDASHDAAWWRQWWSENFPRFGGSPQLPTRK